MKYLTLPLNKKDIAGLKAGDFVSVTGKLYTARDAAHKRLVELINKGLPLPIDLNGQTIYYVGPCMKDGKAISAGPTTSSRMDAYTPTLIDNGLVATIGKGERSDAVYSAIERSGGVYFAAIGGAGALYASKIESVELVAYPELGTEAIYCFTVKDLPLVVAIDSHGSSIYRK